MIWFTNYPNIHIHIFLKHWSFILGCFFPISFLKECLGRLWWNLLKWPMVFLTFFNKNLRWWCSLSSTNIPRYLCTEIKLNGNTVEIHSWVGWLNFFPTKFCFFRLLTAYLDMGLNSFSTEKPSHSLTLVFIDFTCRSIYVMIREMKNSHPQIT